MSAEQFFNQYKENLYGGINTCCLGRIERFDSSIMQADITILPSNDLIMNVPVHTPQTSEFIIRMPFKVGDLGFVVFAQNEIDSTMYGIEEQSARQMAVDDAIFIGGIHLFSDVMPPGHENDLIISKKDISTKIVLTEDGDILLEPARNLIINAPGNIAFNGGTVTANGEDLTEDLT